MRKMVMIFLVIIYIIWNAPYSTSLLQLQKLETGDKNQNGINDNLNIVQGAKEYIRSNVKYKSKYYANGYPDDEYGVCSDVVIQAYLYAGIELKSMIDKDIKENLDVYGIETPDSNIDFRRVRNLNIFFERYGEKLAIDNPNDFQAGDIVVYHEHIGICSDSRNILGFPFLIHLTPLGAYESNTLTQNIKVHYRFLPQK